MHPYHHALSSAKKFGGEPEDYLKIHEWFDESKEMYADFRHRALRHHSQGIYEAERVFGVTLVNSKGQRIPVRYVGEQHVKEDLGFIPSIQDWFKHIAPQGWMSPRPQHVDPEIADQSLGRPSKVVAVIPLT